MRVEVRYCYRGGSIDLDNFLKPMLDGIGDGGVYYDDSQVVQLYAEKVDLAMPYSLPDVTYEVSQALLSPGDFIIIRVEEV